MPRVVSQSAGCWLLLGLALGGCHRAGPSGLRELTLADREAAVSHPGARTLALAGFHAYLVQGDAALAQERFDQALARRATDPYALYGQHVLARRRGHPERALAAALDLCLKAPRHPLASVAARYALDLSGAAVPLDDQILAASEKALGAGLSAEAAHLLRSASANIYASRDDTDRQAALLKDMGVPTRYTVLGPFFAHHVLSFDDPVPPESNGSLEGPLVGPFGPLSPRALTAPDGRVSLWGEGPEGDGYLLVSDFEAAASARYAVRTVTSASHKVYLDGSRLFERRQFERTQPWVTSSPVEIGKGRHRLMIKLIRDERTPTVGVSLMRLDGQASELSFGPADGKAPSWSGADVTTSKELYGSAAELARALRPEAGEALSEYIATRDAMGRDRDGAKRLLFHLSQTLHGPALAALRAEVALGDRSVPTKIAHGRATRDLEAAVGKDPGDVSSLLYLANAALEENRPVQAADLVKRAKDAFDPPGYPVALVDLRAQNALGGDAQADAAAEQALSAQPGLCEASTMRYELARRRASAQASERLLKQTSGCPGWLARQADHARGKGDLLRASALLETLLEHEPGQVNDAMALINLYVGQKRYADAEAVALRLLGSWPRNPSLWKHLAEVEELAGKSEAALRSRRRAIELDGSDLSLRRTLARQTTGKEPLANVAIDGKAAIAAYEASPGTEDASHAYVLDAAAVQVDPDGSMVDRIHIIEKVLTQAGVSEVAEVNIPGSAQLLSLRTIKPDGTSLEPENIEGKESVSLPGVQVGDFVEYEYLQAHPARGPAEPGFTAASFYFQIARVPNNWSTYLVLAPKSVGMSVDAHNTQAPAIETQGELQIFRHEQRRVPPYIPEPDGPPSPNEFLPFVSVGAGSTGNRSVVEGYADAFANRGQITWEVDQFATRAASGKTGLEAVKAIHAAVMDRLLGHDAGLSQSAASSLASDRGSRLWLLKAGLEAIGIHARIALVRTFAVDPAPYRFPDDSLLPYACLLVRLPDGRSVWLDPMIRFGPFAELPEQASGGREAWLLPEPGYPVEQVTTPVDKPAGGKQVRLRLKVSTEGSLSGIGDEVYSGFEAAQLGEALESISADQREQALQSALSHYFGGAELSKVKLDSPRSVGAKLLVHYEFTAPRFARIESDKLVMSPVTFPAQLGRRFVQTGSRRTPLFIGESERNETSVELQLPPGYVLSSPVADLKLDGKFGSYRRREHQSQDAVAVEEAYAIPMARIPPKDYDDFAQFAGEVDLVQSRDLVAVSNAAKSP